MPMTISIKQLHQTTGALVRMAARSKSPIQVTDRGKPVAVLVSPALLAARPRRRRLLAEYKALLLRKPAGSVLDNLDAVRDDR